MRTCALVVVSVLVTACSVHHVVVELPQPNSGRFSFLEAERRKAEIFDLAPSDMFLDWRNPNVGFCVHLSDADEILVYNASGLGAGRGPRKSSVDQLQALVGLQPGFGNPVGVLVTSSLGPDSRVLPCVVDALFQPGVQIYYLRVV